MNKIHHFFLLPAFCILTLAYCAGISVERNVQDNLFTSSHAPKIAVKIHPDLKYMGKYEVTRSIPTIFGQVEGRKVRVTYTGYLFLKLGDGRRIEKMCSITFSRILDQHTVQPDAPLKEAGYDVTPGTLQMAEVSNRDPYNVVANPLTYGINQYVYDVDFTSQFSTAGCYLFKTIRRTIGEDAKTLMVIDYAEGLETPGMCQGWNQPTALLREGQKERLGKFLRNIDKNIQILRNGE